MVSDHVIAPRALEDGSCYSFVTNCIFSDYKTVKIKKNAYSMQNLFAGQRYVFRVRFIYQVGIRFFESVFSEWSTTIQTLPDKPSWTVVPGEPRIKPKIMTKLPGMVILQWDVPRENGFDVDNYNVRMTTAAVPTADSWTTVLTETPGAIGFVKDLQGLSNIKFHVIAHNRMGWSDASDVSTPVNMDSTEPLKPATPPSCPTADAELRALTVTWTPPKDGGDPITLYRVEYNNVPSFSAGVKEIEVEGTATDTEIEDLIPGTIYYIRVTAQNLNGWGPPSDPSPYGACKTKEIVCTTYEKLTFLANSDNDVQCVPCQDGYESKGGQALSCDACARGKHRIGVMEQCSDCEAGRFAREPGHVTCTLCPRGRATEDEGTIECEKCEAGKAAPRHGMVACEGCGLGKFAALEGQVHCVDCSVGMYTECYRATECNDCLVGTYAPTTGMSRCKDCEPGKFQPVEGTTTCHDCLAGTFMTVTGQSVCLECELGRFAAFNGSLVCSNCGAGTHAPSKGMSACLDCGAGRFLNLGAQSECLMCPTGTAENGTASIGCEKCDTGKFQVRVGPMVLAPRTEKESVPLRSCPLRTAHRKESVAN